MLKTIRLAIAGLLFAFGSLFSPAPHINQNLGASNFQPVQTQKTTLSAAGIGTSDVTIGLTSLKLPDGVTTITMSNFGSIGYGTLEPGTSKEESISFTGITQNASGSATLTGVSRGLRFVYPYDSVSANKLTHAGGSIFVVSNTAPFYYNQFVLKNSDGTISQILTFSSTSQPVYDGSPNFTNALSLIDKQYADSLTINGAPTSTQNSLGVVVLATKAQQVLGTASSTTGAPLVLQSGNATSTCTAFAASSTLVLQSDGTINSGCIALGATYNWTGTNNYAGQSNLNGGLLSTASTTFTASTSIAASNVNGNALTLNGLPYSMQSTRAASSTALQEDGSGHLSFSPQTMMLVGATTTSSAQLVATSSVASTNKDLMVKIFISGIGGADDYDVKFNNDSGANYSFNAYANNVQVTSSNGANAITFIPSTTTAMYLTLNITNQSATRKFISWTGTSQSSGTAQPIVLSGSGIWNNTSANITSIRIFGGNVTQTLNSGTYIKAYSLTDN